MLNYTSLLVILLVLFSSILISFCDDNNHHYKEDEIVTLWVNTVGPYHNPQETYPYYQLPFCKPDLGINTQKRPSGIGEILEGNELRNSGFKVHFMKTVEKEDVCDMQLNDENAKIFDDAI